MKIQYFIVTAIVLVVLIQQYRTYKANEKKIDEIKSLFPLSNNTSAVQYFDDNQVYTKLVNQYATGRFKDTLDDINSYLVHNKNKTYDYHILKEIVDRNSQSLEDEVDTMLTVPLYWGLIATIFGIAFGVVIFAWKDLANLLSGSDMSPEGIKILLTDVGIAMFASLAGVFFTKQSTAHYNEARTEMAKNKNHFLTWIQTDLMSKLSDDISGALIKMAQDLNNFNQTFANNTRELKETLSAVKNNYEGQVKLLQVIDKLKINKIAKANIEVYDKLQGCTEELENLFEIFANSEAYVSKVVELNRNIGSIEERTQLFEELGNYFKKEIEFVSDRQGMMRQQISSIDSVLQEALSNLGDSLSNSIGDLTVNFQEQNQRIRLLIEEQQNALAKNLEEQQNAVNERIGQLDNPFSGLKETVEEGIKGIKEVFETQSTAFAEILSSQKVSLEKSLETQQQAIIQKLQETPGQLQALAELSKTFEKLNKTLNNQSGTTLQPSVSVGGKGTKDKGAMALMICAYGSFASLLVLLVLRILGL